MIITKFKGYSGSCVELVKENKQVFVRKTGNVARNYERLSALHKLGLPVSRVLNYYNDTLEIEYIHGTGMINYLQRNQVNNIIDFLTDTINALKQSVKMRDYTAVYHKKFDQVKFDQLPFDRIQLLNRLPKQLPNSEYYGDLTLENIIATPDGFVLIDAATIEYDSYVFDLAKLKQDLVVKWFLRSTNINLDYKLQAIDQSLTEKFGPVDPSLIIVQLLRVYRHATDDKPVREFLREKMRMLWKL